MLAKAYQLSRGNPIEDAIEMFARAARSRSRRRARALDVSGARHHRLREGHPEGRVRGRRGARRDGGARAVRAAHLRRPARHRRRRRPGHQDHRAARRPREGLPAEHRSARPATATSCRRSRGASASRSRQFAEAAFTAREMPVFGHGCVLFLQSEIANVQRQGWKPRGDPRRPGGRAAARTSSSTSRRRPNLVALRARGSCCRAARSATWRSSRRRSTSSATTSSGQDRAAGHRPARALRRGGRDRRGARGDPPVARRAAPTTFIGLDAAERDHVRHAVRRGHALPLLQERVPAHVHRRVDRRPARRRRRRPPTSSASRPPLHRRRVREGRGRGRLAEMRGIKAADGRGQGADAEPGGARGARGLEAARTRPSVADPLPPAGWTRGGARAPGAASSAAAALRVGIPRVFNMYALRAALQRLSREPRRGADEHRLSRTSRAPRCTATGASRGRHRPVLPVEGRAGARPQPAVRQAPRDAARLHLLPDVRRAAVARSSARRASNACPTVALTPQTVRAAFTKETRPVRRAGRRVPRPAARPARTAGCFARQMFEIWAPLLGLSWEENERAIEAGFAALGRYEAAVRPRGARGARRARARGPARHRAARPAVPPRPGPQSRHSRGTAEARLRRVLAEHAAARRGPAGAAVRRRGARRASSATRSTSPTCGSTRSRPAAT